MNCSSLLIGIGWITLNDGLIIIGGGDEAGGRG